MIRLSAFADEISPDLDEQVSVLQDEGIHFIDFRSVWRTKVLDLSTQELTRVKKTLAAHDIQVAAIGSPVGKVPVDSSFSVLMHQFERAVEAAHALNTPFIRMFSFYPPSNQPAADPASYRDEVLFRLSELTMRARTAGVILLHENEKGIYGDTIARCVDLFTQINDPCFLSVLDPANYLQCDQLPYPSAYEATQRWLGYVHVKDVRADGMLVVAGEGETCWPDLLQRLSCDHYDGFLALEPHLSSTGPYHGFSGPSLFRQASQALQNLLHAMHWQYA